MSHNGPAVPKDPISGLPKKPRSERKRFQRDRSVTQLAEVSFRPKEELIEWIRSGKLRGEQDIYGEWWVWGSNLDRWRELVKEVKNG